MTNSRKYKAVLRVSHGDSTYNVMFADTDEELSQALRSFREEMGSLSDRSHNVRTVKEIKKIANKGGREHLVYRRRSSRSISFGYEIYVQTHYQGEDVK